MTDLNKNTDFHYGAFQTGLDGGAKRTRQLQEWIRKKASLPVLSVSFEKSNIVLIALAAFFFPWVLFMMHGCGLSLRGYLKCMLIRAKIAVGLRGPGLFYIETDRNFGILFSLVLLKLRIPQVVFPHNIEFLVPNQKQGPNFINEKFLRDAEIVVFKGAATVYTISEFDYAVVASLNGNAHLLPYSPIDDELKKLQRIASKRKLTTGRSHKFLAIGTASNLPTATAFKASLVNIGELLQTLSCRLIVVGKGTNSLGVSHSNVDLLGYVDEQVLEEILVKVDAAIIPVAQTSGFLTRISELRVAGVPVIVVGNYIQVNGMVDDGIFYIQRLADLDVKIKNILSYE